MIRIDSGKMIQMMHVQHKNIYMNVVKFTKLDKFSIFYIKIVNNCRNTLNNDAMTSGTLPYSTCN